MVPDQSPSKISFQVSGTSNAFGGDNFRYEYSELSNGNCPYHQQPAESYHEWNPIIFRFSELLLTIYPSEGCIKYIAYFHKISNRI